MAEYVNRAELINRIESELMRWGESEYNVLQVLGDIEDFPTADVVEVVRCNKCSHCEIVIDQFDNDWYFCKKTANNAEVKPNDFCSSSERRTDDAL